MSETHAGYRAIEERLKAGAHGVLYVARENPRIERLRQLARKRNVRIAHETLDALDRLCGGADHRGAVLVVERSSEPPPPTIESFLAAPRRETDLVLVLDGITDVHNFGAILRSADQFGANLVASTERRSAGAHASRASAGAAVYARLAIVANLPRALASLKAGGFWVYGAESKGERIDRIDSSGPAVLVMGSEGRGLSRLVAEACDRFVAIPASGHIDSFNVSVAAGILLYELRRKQDFSY